MKLGKNKFTMTIHGLEWVVFLNPILLSRVRLALAEGNLLSSIISAVMGRKNTKIPLVFKDVFSESIEKKQQQKLRFGKVVLPLMFIENMFILPPEISILRHRKSLLSKTWY